MVYTILLLIKHVTPLELPHHPVIKAVPKAIKHIAMDEFECVQISQFYPAGYIHPFEPCHMPPYEAFTYIPTRADDIGYIYIETDHTIASPSHLIASFNHLPEFEGRALFLSAYEGACPVTLITQFIADMQHMAKTDKSIKQIIELYEMALAARYEVDRLVKAYCHTQALSHTKH